MRTALLVYALGVLVGLVGTDARPLARVALALAWPLGPLAFAITVATLVAVAAVAFPLVGAALGLLGVAAWWIMG